MNLASRSGMFALVMGAMAVACATGDAASEADPTTDVGDAAPAGPAVDGGGATADAKAGPTGDTDGHAPDAGADASLPPTLDASLPPTLDAGDAAAPPVVDASPGVDSAVGPNDAGCVVRLVVNEVQSAGATASDEFVELYNPTACDVSLAGWTLRYASVNGTTISTVWTGPAGKSVAPLGFAVVAGSGFSASPTVGAFGGSGTLAATGGGIGIYDPSGARIDSVGYGAATNPLVEGKAAPSPATSASIARKPDGYDHDDNSTDLKALPTPTPGAPN